MGDVGDATLVRRAREGDGDSFALLYARYKKHVWDLSYYMCARNHHEAEEAVQETFLKAWRGLGRFGGRSTFKCWLLSICRNVCIDRLRSTPRATIGLDVLEQPGGPHEAAADAARGDTLQRIALRGALGDLARDECEAWFLIDVLGCTSAEAARVVGVRAATTMRSRVTRARAQIARAIGEVPAEPPGEVRDAEICGLYRSGADRAIVAALVTGIPAPAARPPFVWCDGRMSPSAVAPGVVDVDLVRFFDRLEHLVPTTARIVAVVGGKGTPEAERWRVGHPRWQLLRAPTHHSWNAEAHRLLATCPACQSTRRAGEVLALLDAAEPFVWTYGHEQARV